MLHFWTVNSLLVVVILHRTLSSPLHVAVGHLTLNPICYFIAFDCLFLNAHQREGTQRIRRMWLESGRKMHEFAWTLRSAGESINLEKYPVKNRFDLIAFLPSFYIQKNTATPTYITLFRYLFCYQTPAKGPHSHSLLDIKQVVLFQHLVDLRHDRLHVGLRDLHARNRVLGSATAQVQVR